MGARVRPCSARQVQALAVQSIRTRKGADRRRPRSAFRCSAAERFHTWYIYGREHCARAELALDSDAGTLYHSLKNMNMLCEVLQYGTGELKRENLTLVLDVLISDVASTLSFWQHAIKGAPNGIGLITWIMNFGGNIFFRKDGNAAGRACTAGRIPRALSVAGSPSQVRDEPLREFNGETPFETPVFLKKCGFILILLNLFRK